MCHALYWEGTGVNHEHNAFVGLIIEEEESDIKQSHKCSYKLMSPMKEKNEVLLEHWAGDLTEELRNVA